MKKLLGLAVSFMCCVGIAEQTKEVTLHFDPARLVMEVRGASVLFRYRDPACKYVEQERGAPVLPAVFFNVLMPKGAVYVHSRVRAEVQPYRGTYRLYTRAGGTSIGARRFPRSIVEFVGHRDIDGFRVFTFRAYPVCCQPADGSVARVLTATLSVKYTVKDQHGRYAAVSAETERRVKRNVINPEDFERLTLREDRGRGSRGEKQWGTSDEALFATQIRERSVAAPPRSESAGIFTLLKENVYINDENDIVYAPIRF